ncbi:MAG: DoxX family protein [Salibacteraceae bacterium]
MEKPGNTLNILLWIAQVILAAIFLMAGFMKSFTPMDELADSLPWVTNTPVALVRFIGISELLGALGMILPSALRILPKLTVVAAVGLCIVMVLAAGFHILRSEWQALPINFALFALSAFVAWGRSKKVVIQAKK